jgi:hypothetical protein
LTRFEFDVERVLCIPRQAEVELEGLQVVGSEGREVELEDFSQRRRSLVRQELLVDARVQQLLLRRGRSVRASRIASTSCELGA